MSWRGESSYWSQKILDQSPTLPHSKSVTWQSIQSSRASVFTIKCKERWENSYTFQLLPSPLQSSFSEFIWNAVSQAAVLILPQINLNLKLSHCANFFHYVSAQYYLFKYYQFFQMESFVRDSPTHTTYLSRRWTVNLMFPGFPGGASGKEPTCQCRRHKKFAFDPWVGKILWRRAWQLTLLFLPGDSHGRRRLVGYDPWGHKD